LASSASALTRRLPAGISKSPWFSMVSLGMVCSVGAEVAGGQGV
jgi:hypothetical protein